MNNPKALKFLFLFVCGYLGVFVGVASVDYYFGGHAIPDVLFDLRIHRNAILFYTGIVVLVLLKLLFIDEWYDRSNRNSQD